MMERYNCASATLGEMVAMVEEIEEKQGGTAWGEETIILFRANFDSTMTLLCSAIKRLKLTEESLYTPSDFQQHLSALDKEEEFCLDEEGFSRGYYQKKGIDYPLKKDNTPKKPLEPEGNPTLSWKIGEFFALVHCMEFGSGRYQEEELEGEGVLMMLALNFSSTLSMLQQGIQCLPEEAYFHQTKITLAQVKETWEPLAKEEISPAIINHASFLDGYNGQVAQYKKGGC